VRLIEADGLSSYVVVLWFTTPEPPNTFIAWVGREERRVDRADGRADDEVGTDTVRRERPQHPDLNGAEAATAREHERGSRGGAHCYAPANTSSPDACS
jgi:hypothetical protein